MSSYATYIFRRQYLFTNQPVEIFENWKSIFLEKSNIYTYVHPELDFVHLKEGEVEILMLGYALSYQVPEKTDLQITQDLLANKTLADFIQGTNALSGRFLFLYANAQGSYIVPDPMTMRKAYYYFDKSSDRFLIGSQCQLIKQFVELEKQDDPEFWKFVDSSDFKDLANFMIGDETYYKEAKQLMPNHYLDITKKEVKRFFPTVAIPTIKKSEIDVLADKANAMLYGFLKAIILRKKISMPFTAGWDSRMLVAISRDFKDEIPYFINQFSTMPDTHSDVWVPKKLSEKLGINFKVNQLADIEVEKNFRDAYYASYDMPVEKYLPGHYAQSHLYGDTIIMHTIGSELAKCTASKGIEHLEVTPVFLCIVTYYGNTFKYPLKQAEKWIEAAQSFIGLENIHIADLYSWENTEANMTAGAIMQGDMYRETCSIFNCRELITSMWATPAAYRQAYHLLTIKMIKKVWAEALSEPMNPATTFPGHIKKWLARLGLHGYFRGLRRKFLIKESANNSSST